MSTDLAPIVYLLIQTEAGHAVEASASLRALAGDDAIEVVQGAFDIIARVTDERTEADVLRRCELRPFIRVLPCRVGSRPERSSGQGARC
jgi:hypothetical protein